MITPARKRELAVLIGAERTKHALKRTPDGVVYRIISEFDDFAYKPDAEVRQDAAEIAALIRTGQSIVTFPHEYVGTGDGETPRPLAEDDRVRLVEPVGHLAKGCEGTILAGVDGRPSFIVAIDGYMETIVPAASLERIPPKEA